ncbi:LOW QUALITY PROTEIN: hypothetical protein PHMEG_00019227 [Phytophthora megakarya]|uniref:Uncharacterized protein n=1 Tax=Phytophthora megakarya TaxID=4795 RepID=A0A225VTK0_9STRA|nr:LOW QUALITY PROTEIN: hypothetical protein PHMEG_00019227 [Phytophthora megakarya]
MTELRRMCTKHDIWRVVLCDDPLAKIAPYKLKLKSEVEPYRSKAHTYNLCKFLKYFNKQLMALHRFFKNPGSKWACTALPIRKSKAAVDYKPLNAKLEFNAGTTPNFKIKLEHDRGIRHNGLFDFIRSFWQLGVDKDSQEMLSYMTDEGVFRAPCKTVVIPRFIFRLFAELLHDHQPICIDDLLHFAYKIEEYLTVLEKHIDLVN